VHVMVEATVASGSMLRWVMQMLVPGKDQVFLARGAAFDTDGRLLPSAKRVFDTYRLQLSGANFEHHLCPCEGVRKNALCVVCFLWHLVDCCTCLLTNAALRPFWVYLQLIQALPPAGSVQGQD
jgi:hypothetical protein